MPIVSADKFKYFEPERGVSNIQARMIVPGQPSIPSEAASAGASQILRVGDELEKMGRAIREAQVRDDVQRFTLGAMDELGLAEQEVMREGDHRSMPNRFRARLGEIQTKYQEKTAGDQAVSSAFNEKFGLLAQHHVERVRIQSWKRELDQQQAYTIEAGDTTLKLIGRSVSPGEVLLHRNDFVQSLESKVQSGLIDASWAASYKLAWDKQIGVMQVRRKIELDPAGALQMLQTPGAVDEYVYGERLKADDPRTLGEDSRHVLLKEASAVVRARQIEQKAGLETGVYRSLFDRFGGDPDLMRKALTDPREMETYGITLDHARSIEGAITDLEKKRNADMLKTEVGYFQKLYQGKLSEFEIAQDVEVGRVTPKIGEHWMEAIQKRNNVVDPTAQASEIVKVNRMISQGEDPDKIRQYLIRSGSLKKEDKEQYLGKLEMKLSHEMEEGRKLGYQEIAGLITPKRGALSQLLQTPLESVATSKAQMALDDWLAGQKKEGKEPSLNEIRRKAISFGEVYQVPISSKIEEMEQEALRAAAGTKEYAKIKAERNKRLKEEEAARKKGQTP